MGNKDAVVDPLIGELIGGKYRVIQHLGTGGMGTVYKALDPALGRVVAVKMLTTDDPGLSHRFAEEARYVADIDHTNVISVYERGRFGKNVYYIVMQYIDGKSLDDFQASRGSVSVPGLPHITDRLEVKAFDLETAVFLIRQMCAGLNAIHAKGIHRDLKPGNVMVGIAPDGTIACVKILDFGLAKMALPTRGDPDATQLDMDFQKMEKRPTQIGAILGTPPYMEPSKQLIGRETFAGDRFVDIYAMAAMLYEMLAGRIPYEDSTPMREHARTQDPQIYYSAWAEVHAQKCPLTRITEIRPDLPKHLDAFFQRALGHDHGSHFQTTQDFLAALDSAIRDTKPPPEPSMSSVLKPVLNPWVAGTLAVVTLLLLGLVAWALLGRDSRHEQAASSHIDARTLPRNNISVPMPPPLPDMNAIPPRAEDAAAPSEQPDATVETPSSNASDASVSHRSRRRPPRHNGTPCGGLLPNGMVRICIH